MSYSVDIWFKFMYPANLAGKISKKFECLKYFRPQIFSNIPEEASDIRGFWSVPVSQIRF